MPIAVTSPSLSFFSSSIFPKSRALTSSTPLSLSLTPTRSSSSPSFSVVSSQMAQLEVFSFSGEKVGDTQLDLKSAPPDTARAVVHRGIVTDLRNRRRGTASTLTRGEVRGGGKKPFPQKKLGRARRGSQRTPLRPGGGVVFGPKPKDWSIKINRKEKRLAISTAIASAVLAADALVVEDEFGENFEDRPKTKDFIDALRRLGLDPSEKSTFLMMDVPDNVRLSGRTSVPSRCSPLEPSISSIFSMPRSLFSPSLPWITSIPSMEPKQLCVKCSGVHRGLGSHISKVLSVSLDEWSDDEINSMIEVGGNSYANAIYEAFLPRDYLKPRANASTEERTAFIRSKYELQEFLTPSLRIVSQNFSKSSSMNVGDFSENDDGTFNSKASNRTEGMIEFIGILHAKVIKGTRLAVRDMLTSDPYVVLICGQQKAQTTVAHSNLNPIWNEVLKLSIPCDYTPLKVEVYDHDTLSKDDIMGEAEIDLQPLINSASAFKKPELLGNIQIGKWHKSEDNALAEDSTVNIVEGKVKQVVRVKLQNVESGEIELELEWISLDQ